MSRKKPTPSPTGDALLALRDGARTILAQAIGRVAAGSDPVAAKSDPVSASRLEQAIYDDSLAAEPAQRRTAYSESLRNVMAGLAYQIGPFPDDLVADRFLAGKLTAAQVVEIVREPPAEPDEREVVRRLFVRTLLRAAPEYQADRARTLETARAIESSCYNAVVRAIKNSEEPTRRNWDSPQFADIYSTRCGAVATLLDPDSSACRAYGATLVPRLLAGTLAPEDLGGMSSRELCPDAMAAERAQIAARTSQRVVEKESIMFRCPHCGARRCTYREVQNRSLDEAPDYRCKCLNCDREFVGRS